VDHQGKVSAGFFHYAPDTIGIAPEAVSDSIGEIHGYQDCIDMVHYAQKLLRSGKIIAPQAVQQKSPELSYRFCKTVEICRICDAQGVRIGYISLKDNAVGYAGLSKFLKSVMHVVGAEQIVMCAGQILLELMHQRSRRVYQIEGVFLLPSVDGPDGS